MNNDKRIQDKKIVDSVKVQDKNYKNYESKVGELKKTYINVMNDYNKYAPLVINEPSNLENKQMYSNIKLNIQNIFSSLFQISNKIEEENNEVLNNIDIMDILIENEKQTKDELDAIIKDTHINTRSSTTLMNDYTLINYEELYILLSLIFSIIFVVIVGFTIKFYYRNRI